MFSIRPAETTDVSATVAALGAAFSGDPLMPYFFRGAPAGVGASATTFFSILLRVRLALGMPAHVLVEEGKVLGLVMGYDTSRPAWPDAFNTEWRQLEAAVPGFGARLAAYDAISVTHQPDEPHYYLGVIGVHPALQGKGAGRALIETFCELSRRDPKSRGVYLDTGSPQSLQFYLRNGFELRGQGSLDAATLWCVYRPT